MCVRLIWSGLQDCLRIAYQRFCHTLRLWMLRDYRLCRKSSNRWHKTMSFGRDSCLLIIKKSSPKQSLLSNMPPKNTSISASLTPLSSLIKAKWYHFILIHISTFHISFSFNPLLTVSFTFY